MAGEPVRSIESGRDAHRRPLRACPPPSIAHRLRRLLFSAVWLLGCRWSPVALHAWRRTVLRAFGAELAPGALVYPSARVWAPWMLTMDADAVLGPRAICYNVDRITLRARAIVSQGAHLCSASHDFNDVEFPLVTAPIVVESKAWICADAFLGPGVTVGYGAVIGARAVVTRDVPPRAVVVGNPAKIVAERRPDALSRDLP